MSNTSPVTGYPSVDKPWLSFYSKEAIAAPLPNASIYEYIVAKNKDHPMLSNKKLQKGNNKDSKPCRQRRKWFQP